MLRAMSQERYMVWCIEVSFLDQPRERKPEAPSVGHYRRGLVPPLAPPELSEDMERELPGLTGLASLERPEIDRTTANAGVTDGQVQSQVLQKGRGLTPARRPHGQRLHPTNVEPHGARRTPPEGVLDKVLRAVKGVGSRALDEAIYAWHRGDQSRCLFSVRTLVYSCQYQYSSRTLYLWMNRVYAYKMSLRKHRADLIPNANNPRLLQRLVRLVASGIRKQRALADVLQIELRTVHYYTQAGEWLGLLATDKEVHLTPRGVEFAFAEARQRPKLYAHAVWSVPLVQALLSGRGDLPDTDVIASFILENEPSMAPRTARRRATSLRGLVEPALRHRPSRARAKSQQLSFGFMNPTDDNEMSPARRPLRGGVDLSAGTDQSPDVYARLLTALLDHGEITTGQLRALLDEMGARDCPLGGYIEMAIRRSDAVRQADRLVATAGAAKRRDFASDGVLTALTDPAYRAYIGALMTPEPTPEGQRERQTMAKKFAAWDLRIFGQPLSEETVAEAIARPLVGRRLESLPVADSPGAPAIVTTAPFLDMVGARGLAIAFPSALVALSDGVSGVNEALTRIRNAPAGVRAPSPVDTRSSVHGGLLSPGETLPRSIPDNLTLRLRLLTHCPAFTLLTAMLLLDRQEAAKLRVIEDEHGPSVLWRKARMGGLLEVLERFSTAQGWMVIRPLSGGLRGTPLVNTGVAAGIVSRVGKRVVLNEQLFLRLQEDPEAHLTYDALLPLEDRLHAWLDQA